ncbi:MAG: murein biosynthesis integral membrane protein MurJ [Actinomycetia bacterium]|nr:murein biosynthesis integral membrane protein MurJ [Actinomycetes bacterium]
MSTGTQVAKATGLIVLITLASKVTGFLRTVVLADVYGATCLTDSYMAATVYPNTLFAGINSALATTFIPLYTEIRERRGRASAYDYANTVFTVLFLALVALMGIGFVTALPVLPLYVPGWVGKACAGTSQIQLTLELTWVMLPTLLFIGLAAVQTGILQAEADFGPPAAVGIPQNLLLIAVVLGLAGRLNIFAAALGTLVGGSSYVALQAVALRRHGFRYRPRLAWRSPELARMGRMVLPVFLSTFVGQAGYIVDRILASTLAPGSISALSYAALVNNVVLGIFVTALVTVMYPTLARYTAHADYAGFLDAIRRALGVLALVTLPVAVGTAVLRLPVVEVVFERGAFGAQAAAQTAYALVFFAVGLTGNAAAILLPRAFFALQDTRTPTLYGLVAVAVNIVADLLLIRPLAQGGLALGTSLAQWALAGLLLWQLRRRTGPLGGSRLARTFVKSLAAAGVTGAVVDGLYRLTRAWPAAHGFVAQAAQLAFLAAVGAAVYAVLTWRFRVEETAYLLDILRQGWTRLRAAV